MKSILTCITQECNLVVITRHVFHIQSLLQKAATILKRKMPQTGATHFFLIIISLSNKLKIRYNYNLKEISLKCMTKNTHTN